MPIRKQVKDTIKTEGGKYDLNPEIKSFVESKGLVRVDRPFYGIEYILRKDDGFVCVENIRDGSVEVRSGGVDCDGNLTESKSMEKIADEIWGVL